VDVKKLFALPVISLIILTHCGFNDASKPQGASGPRITVTQEPHFYAEHGEHRRLSSFDYTLFSPKHGLISMAGYLDFDSGAAENPQDLFLHRTGTKIPLKKYIKHQQVLSLGPPLEEKLPILLGTYQDDGCYLDVKVLIWDLNTSSVSRVLPISNEYYRRRIKEYSNTDAIIDCPPEGFGELKSFPTTFTINMRIFGPRIDFIDASTVQVIYPTRLGLNHYQVLLHTKEVKETEVISPNINLGSPFNFTSRFSIEEKKTLLSFTINSDVAPLLDLPHNAVQRLGSKQAEVELELSPFGEIKAHARNKSPGLAGFYPSSLNFRTYGSRDLSVETWLSDWPVNRFEGKLRIVQGGIEKGILDIQSTNYSLRWAKVYKGRYLLLAGEHGEKHAETHSLVSAGSIFVIILDLVQQSIVLQSEFYSGQQHRFVDAGIVDNTMWMSFNHNFGGNHDGNTVRRTTTGRVLKIHLPDEIRARSQLSFKGLGGSFRPFTGKLKFIEK
jgi:hypothetical protein